jgi:hypothetical protein
MELIQTNPRLHFFNEEGDQLPPFRLPGWRGCVIDRDQFDSTNMPRELFDAVVKAAGSEQLFIARYTPGGDGAEQIAANWDAFREFVFTPEHWSLEFVLFDSSTQWAILAELDVTVFGASSELAAAVDAILVQRGLSLAGLTDHYFPGLDPVNQPGARYILAVTGR